MSFAFVGPMTNPLGWAWLTNLRSLDDAAFALDVSTAGEGPHSSLGPGPADAIVVPFRDAPRVPSPVAALHWWGHKSLTRIAELATSWPSTRHYICVDTLPDARRPAGELREAMSYRSHRRRVAGYVVASAQMERDLRRIVGKFARIHYMPVVFSRSAMSRPIDTLPNHLQLPNGGERPRLVFTGRADHLFTTSKSMRKDGVGTLLLRLVDRGFEVHVSSFAGQATHPLLQAYPRIENREVLNGTFATYLSQFDAQLLVYNPYNHTIRRRVRNSLSTRLAIAAASGSPWVVAKQSLGLCDELWQGRPWGLDLDNPELTPSTLRQSQLEFRSSISAARHRLSSETYLSGLADLMLSS